MAADDLVHVPDYPAADRKTQVLAPGASLRPAATAALKAAQEGGWTGIPARRAVEQFLEEHVR